MDIKDGGLGKLIIAFILIITGLALLTTANTSVNDLTTLGTHTNESIAIASGTGSTDDDNVTSVTFFGNSTENTEIGGWVIGTDVNVTSAGVVTTAGNVSDGNYVVSYAYQPNNYISDGTSRAVTKLIPIFFALGILSIGLAFGYSGIKEFM